MHPERARPLAPRRDVIARPDVSDAVLVRALCAGREHAFDVLVARHAAAVGAYLAQLVGPDAEDLAQEVFLKLHTRGDTIRGERVRVWLFAVARRAALDHLRRRGTRRRLLEGWRRAPRRRAAPSAHDELEGAELARALTAELAALPETWRSVVFLREREGLSYAEIGTILGLEEKTVSTRLSRARARLRTRLAPWLDAEGER